MDHLLFTDNDILERLDEYALYCHYLGFNPMIGAKYHSPVRSTPQDDENPSFGIFERKAPGYCDGNWPNEFLWKDQAIGVHGDIFGLVMRLFEYQSRGEAYKKVMGDFGIGHAYEADRKILLPVERTYLDPPDITVLERSEFSPKDLGYWGQFNITLEILQRYRVSSIRAYWMVKDQKFPNFPKGGIGYRAKVLQSNQLYFPYAAKKFKFRNDMTPECVFGFEQAAKNTELLIITKSLKDVMCLRSFGYEAIAPRGESILLPPQCVSWAQRYYSKCLVLFDTDMKHKGDEYPFDKIYVQGGPKDISDHCKMFGVTKTAQMLKQITNT